MKTHYISKAMKQTKPFAHAARYVVTLCIFLSFGQALKAQTSAGSGPWSAGATWVGAIVPGAGANVVIAPGHIVTIDNVGDLNTNINITVQGTLTINSGSINPFNNVIVEAGGTVNVEPGGFFLVAGTATIDGTYNHNRDGGNLPVATWGAASNCNVTGIINTALGTAEFAQTFGNFSWNCPSQAVNQTSGTGSDMIVLGDFRVLNVNSLGSPRLTFARNLQVGGDYENQVGVISLNMDGVVFTFNGNTDQTLSGGNGIRFGGLLINKNPASVVEVTSSNLIVLTSLALANGRIRLNNTDLTYAGTEINLTRANGWVETNGTGIGGFFSRPTGTNLTFPVGDAAQYQPVRIANVPASGAIVRFGVPTFSVPNAGLGSWTIRTFGGSSALTFLNPQGGGIDATSHIYINPNFAFTWTLVPTSFSAPDYTTTVAATTGSIDEFSIFSQPAPTLSGFSPTSGVVGTLITISGTGFATSGLGNDVYFGAVKVANVLSADGITLDVFVPLGASSVTPITVVNRLTGLQASSLTSTTPQFTVTLSSTVIPDYSIQSIATGGTDPRVSVAGDFNNDNHADILTANALSDNVTLRLGNGSGGFTTLDNFTVGTNPTFVTTADFDSDGNLDFVAVNRLTDNISVRLGDGTGNFAAGVNYAVGDAPYAAVVADVDNDGDMDIMVTDRGPDPPSGTTLSILKNNGDGTFAPAYTVSGNMSFPNIPDVGDFNGDGNIDIAVPNLYASSISILLGDGTGAFSGTSTFVGNYPAIIKVGDFNEDGNLDLASSHGFTNDLKVHFGDGAGGFSAPVTVQTGDFYENLVVADFDGDGHQDLAASDVTTGVLHVLVGSGTGTFPTIYEFNLGSGNFTSAISTADFNEDGRADMVLSSLTTDDIKLLLWTPIPTLTSFTPTSGAVGTPITITGTNFNPSAPNDVYFGAVKVTANANATGTSITVNVPAGATSVTPITIRNNATGLQVSSLTSGTPQFTVTNTTNLTISPTSYTQTNITTATGPQSTVSGDFDEDGFTDFIVVFGSSSVQAYLNDKVGGFNNSTIFSGAANPAWIAVADFDNDGIQDIAIADDTFNRTHIGLGNGNGTFNFSLVLGGAPVFVATGDFNNDGNVDFATLNGASSLNIRLGVGDGTFTTSPTITVGTNASALTVADFDADGVLDLAVVNAGSDNVSILLGLGDGNFSTPDNYNVGASPQSVIAGDFDQDGNLDLAVANSGSSNVSILLGVGNGTFTNGTDVSVGANPNVVNIADFDGDGFIDLVSGNAGDISIRLGQGNGAFTATADISTGLSPQSITIADFNQDNAVDLVLDGGGFAIGLLTYTPLSVANALNFDGIDDYVSIPNSSIFETNDLTVEMWVRPTYPSDNVQEPCLFAIRGGSAATRISYHIKNDYSGVVVWNGLSEQTILYPFSQDTWYHLTFRSTTTQTEVFVGGILIGSTTNGINTAQIGHPLSIGWSNDVAVSEEYFTGDIDEVRVWNTLRACEQILDGLTCELVGTEPNLVAYYQFNESTGATLPDLAGANDGTLTNFALTGLTSNWVTSTSGVSNTICTFATDFPEISLFDETASLEILSGNTPIVADGTDFGTVAGVSSRTFTIQNLADATLNISQFVSSNPDFAVNTVLASVGPVSSATFEVTYTPGTTGTSTISIFSDDCDEPEYTFNVSATFLATNPFITTWRTDNPGTSSNTQITIPTDAGANYTVYWENTGNPAINGTAGPFTGSATIDFPDIGTYRVEISGDFPRIFFNFGGDAQKILTIEQWGDIAWQTMGNAFAGCSNLTYNATDVPDMTSVTETNNMFNGATVFDGDLSDWDMSGVTNMGSMFADAAAFNNGGQALTWNTSSVQLMDRVFFNATSFNQDISTWNTAAVTNMFGMFINADAFNQPIGNWNVSNVVNFAQMFQLADVFNQDLSNWNMSNAQFIDGMFADTPAFNNAGQPLSNWERTTPNVSTLASVINMEGTFQNATAFNQSLANWNISSVANMTFMLDNCGMDVANYDATLIGWAAQTVQPNVSLGATGLTYCAGETARNTLIGAPNNWTISGDALACLVDVSGNDFGFANENIFKANAQRVYSFQLSAIGGDITLTDLLTQVTGGDYQATDIVDFGLYYNDTADDFATAILLDTSLPSAGNGEVIGFSGFSQTILGDGSPRYFYIAANVNPTAVTGRTFSLPFLTAGDFTFDITPNSFGSSFGPSGIKTIADVTAQTYYAIASGNWYDPAVWSTDACGGTPAASVPSSIDDVVICNGFTITMDGDALCNNLTIDDGGAMITDIFSLFADGAVTVNGSFEDNSVGFTEKGHFFGGLLTVGATGSFTAVDGCAANFNFSNGIVNDGIFTLLTNNQDFAFIDNDQTISTSTSMVFGNNVLGTDAVFCNVNLTLAGTGNINFRCGAGFFVEVVRTVTNQTNTSVGFFGGDLVAADPNSAWINEAGSSLEYEGSAIPMDGGIFLADAPNNSVAYRGDGFIRGGMTYDNLVIRGGNRTIQNGSLVINRDLSFTGTDPQLITTNFDVTLRGNLEALSVTSPSINATGSTFAFNGANLQVLNFDGLIVFDNLAIDNLAGVRFETFADVEGRLELIQGTLEIQQALTLTNPIVTDQLSHTTNAYIYTNGASLIRNGIGSAAFFDFPVGDATEKKLITLDAINNTEVIYLPNPTGAFAFSTAQLTQGLDAMWSVIHLGADVDALLRFTEPGGNTAASSLIHRFDGSNWNGLTTGYNAATPVIYETINAQNMPISSAHFFAVLSGNPPPPSATQPEGNRGMYFDGVDDQILANPDASINFSGADNFTVEAWVKIAEGGTGIDRIVQKWAGGVGRLEYALEYNHTSQIFIFKFNNFSGGGNTLATASYANTNEWVHVAGVKEGSDIRLYINGTLADTQTPTGVQLGALASTGNLYIGRHNGGTTEVWLGQIDEVKIFNTARTEAEIGADMSSTTADGAVGFWRFEEGTGTTAGNTGTSGGILDGTLGTVTTNPLWALRVKNTNDSGTESLREVLTEANGLFTKNYIDFSIETPAPWEISLTSGILPFATQSILIDGTSQQGWADDIVGQRVTLVRNYSVAPAGNNALSLDANDSEIYGLGIRGFDETFQDVGFRVGPGVENFQIGALGKGNVVENSQRGVTSFGGTGFIVGNKFGTDATGNVLQTVSTNNDLIITSGSVTISDNVIAKGISLFSSTASNFVTNNRIGIGLDGNTPLGNGVPLGIRVDGTSGNTISGNFVGNFEVGIQVWNGDNIIQNNSIGQGSDGASVQTNSQYGIQVTLAGTGGGNNITNNIIANTTGFAGVSVETGRGALIVENEIFCNILGISSIKVAPQILSYDGTNLTGEGAGSGERIDIYRDNIICGTNPRQGREYLAQTTADAAGNWTLPIVLNTGDFVLATSSELTTPLTSEFSVPFEIVGFAPFITTWQTTTANETITIPTTGTGYNFTIDWGDTNVETVTDADAPFSHTYAMAGTYTVSITGDFPRIFFNNTGDRLKILSILQWGNIAWTSMQDAFYGCANLTYQASDAPDLSMVSNLNNMFRECINFDGNATIENWDVSTITTMRQTFFGALAFNQPLNNWDVSNVTDMFGLFGSHLNTVTATFNQPLSNWNVSNVTDMSFMFLNNARFNQDISAWQVGSVRNMDFMFALFRTMPDASQFNSPLNTWDVSQVISMEGMFFEAENFDQPLGNWVTTSLSNMNRMFWGARNFNQPIDTWNVSGVSNLDSTFYNANRFNQDLNSWDVSSVSSMIGTFAEATDFNGDISNWEVGIVGDMSNMFAGAFAFNQDISAWNVSSVTSMFSMFNNALSFNQDLSAWDVGQVTEMGAMFLGASEFNNGETGNTSSRPLNGWNTANVSNMGQMFGFAPKFNQDISAWQVGNVSNMGQMFEGATLFNQDISGWDVSNVLRMYLMFGDATAFNQDLSAWDISSIVEDPDVNVTDDALTGMLDNAGLSELNYDATLIGWATLDAGETQIPTGITLGANGLGYCDAQEERQSLLDVFGWEITGDVLNPVCIPTPAPLALSALLITETSFQANWQPVNNVLGYELDVSTDGFATFVGIYNAFSTPLLLENVNGLNPNTTYQYRLRAVGPGGVSDNSNVISVLTLPAAPLALDASAIAGLSFVANWQAQANINNYTVEVATDPAFGTILFTGSAATNSLLIEGLQELSTYYYRVQALNATGASAFSNVIMVSTGPAVLEAPSNLNLTIVSNTQIQLDWTDNSELETGFVIERRQENEADFGQIGTVGANITTFTDNGVTQGITHFYRVKAIRNAQSSDFGETLGALTEVTTALPGLSHLEAQVFPNPSAGLFQLTIKNDYFGAVQVEIISPQGQTLYQHYTNKVSRDLSLHFDLQAYTQGIYLLKVKMGGNFGFWKLVKE